MKVGKLRKSRDSDSSSRVRSLSHRTRSKAQVSCAPVWKSSWSFWLYTHHSSDPVISVLFTPLLLMTCQYLPETHIFSLKTAKMKQEHCRSDKMLKPPLDLCCPFCLTSDESLGA